MDNNALIVAEKLDVTVVFSDKGMTKLLDEIFGQPKNKY